MRRFWDAAAREHAAYYVESRLDYREPDMDEFWAIGEEVVDGYARELDVHVRENDHIVEIGCGIGRVTRALAARCGCVTALDVSGEMLERAREANTHLDNVAWVHGDGTTLNGVDVPADGVFSHVVFQHVPDPEITYGYVRDMGRILKPGGWAAFQVSDDPRVHRPARPGVRAMLRRAPKGTSDPAWVGSAVDLQRLRKSAQEAGMEVTRTVNEGTQYCLVRCERR